MTIKCDCGGTLQPARAQSFDFSALAGLPVRVNNVASLRCDQCGYETLSGEVIESVFAKLTLVILQQPRLLRPEEMVYLRKELRLSPAELAHALDVSEALLEAWETGREAIRLEADQRLRGLVISNRRVPVGTTRAEHLPPQNSMTGRRSQESPIVLSGASLEAAAA
jgi:DNA-binding transcriptional regulator YiaG